MSRQIFSLAVVLLSAGCGVQSSPVAPDPTVPGLILPDPAPVAGPHFALELHHAAGGTVTAGDAWRGEVTIDAHPAIVRPELPVAVSVTCDTEVRTFPGFRSGSAPISCLFSIGTHVVVARAEMAGGQIYAAELTVVVRPAVPASLSMSVSSTVTGTPRVRVYAFATADLLSADRYRWSFDDGHGDTTLVPRTTHTYARNGQYRVSVTAVDAQGQTIGVGAVALTHHE